MRTVLFLIVFLSFHLSYSQTPKEILKNYELVWSDDFNGQSIDPLKWGYRYPGSKRHYGVVTKENTYLDGNGNLVIEVSKKGDSYQIGQIGTEKKFSTKFGYFECRAKMNKELGPLMGFWLQSPLIQKVNGSPEINGAEIDIFEYQLNGGNDYILHNIHWNGYGKLHKRVGKKKYINKLSEGYHTFGLKWTKDEYVFYVDGKQTWRCTEAISQIPQYIILSAELTGWQGDFKKSKFPDKVIFDYVKVYKEKESKKGS